MVLIPWNEYRVLDGGFATQLVKLGHFDIDWDRLWSSRVLVTDPDAVKETHLRFLRAGADIIMTNTYHINVDTLISNLKMNEHDAKAVLTAGVRLAQAARDEYMKSGDIAESKRPLVAGSVGPYAICFADASEYHGNYIDGISAEDLRNWHRPRVAALLDAGVDLIAFETIPAQKEAQVLSDLITEFPNAKSWVSFTVKDGARTAHGEPLSECVATMLENPQIIGLGINCCSPRCVEAALEAYQTARGRKALIVYSNSGEEWTSDREWRGKDEAASISSFVPRWMDLGANWIGGCCRVYDTDIAEIRQTMANKIS